MTRARNSVLLVFLASFAAACSSLPHGWSTLEARGGLASDPDSDHFPSGNDTGEPGSAPMFAGGGNVAWRSYGLRASLNSEEIDVIFGVDRHDFGAKGATEANLGLRLHSTDTGGFYIETALRRGFGLDTVSGRREYSGMEAGIGLIWPLDENWFLDVGCTVEWTFDRWDLGDGNERLSDVLFNVGFGFVF